MSQEKIAAVVRDLADLITVVRNAHPADKAEIYTRLGLRLTYEPGQEPGEGTVRTDVHVSPVHHWQFEGVRRGKWRGVQGVVPAD